MTADAALAWATDALARLRQIDRAALPVTKAQGYANARYHLVMTLSSLEALIRTLEECRGR